MHKEKGLPKNAPPSVKKKDDKMDRDKGIREGSKSDLKVDKQLMLEYLSKKKKRK
jgi:hypothetical protein